MVTTLVSTTAAALGLFIAGTTGASADTTYTVKAGDSVWAIAQKNDTNIKNVENDNNIKNHLILPGQKLSLDTDDTKTTTKSSSATTYVVKSGDSVWSIADKFGTTMTRIEKDNNIKNHLIVAGQKLTINGVNSSKSVGTTTSTTATTPATSSTSQATASSSNTTSNNTASSTKSTTSSSSSSSYTGSTKSYVLSQMESRTGVSASTWNAIITRESNWQPYVRNSSSGAYGLFQNMHISSGSVSAQVDAAVSLYKSQGMGAWAL
ncbi:LysM peptidoglycan-binding domain-containing protein [Secundilactobacillus oryzae]|uniref:LysM peptidoglycan-binding domain-containing protein n=1 Tax=Secundilactobacillus oryzae TaxID=1202668 RepID=UPI0005596085|nr:LysM peptidoglycan-binding domain-containing protein [Secundilactobacillus oryzae]